MFTWSEDCLYWYIGKLVSLCTYALTWTLWAYYWLAVLSNLIWSYRCDNHITAVFGSFETISPRIQCSKGLTLWGSWRTLYTRWRFLIQQGTSLIFQSSYSFSYNFWCTWVSGDQCGRDMTELNSCGHGIKQIGIGIFCVVKWRRSLSTNSIPIDQKVCLSFIQLLTSQLRHRKGPVAKFIHAIQCTCWEYKQGLAVGQNAWIILPAYHAVFSQHFMQYPRQFWNIRTFGAASKWKSWYGVLFIGWWLVRVSWWLGCEGPRHFL